MRRIGIFGGTFDPPHLGHLLIAHQVQTQLALDEVWFVVANDPWQKSDQRIISPASDRLAMTELAVSWANRELRAPGALAASTVELELGGPSYTIVTLEHLHAQLPDVEWVVIVGSDIAAGLDTWHRADDLRNSARFAVVQRPGSTEGGSIDSGTPPDGFSWEPVATRGLEVSSTELRHRLATGGDVGLLTPPQVIDLALSRRIYRPEA